jgi:3'(2'), 5'-bisphosphate nucleotidase
MSLERELELATELARRAGEVVMTYYRSDLAVDVKPGEEPVTRADRESEALILDGLRRAFPDHGTVSEESVSEAAWRLDGRTWIVDPLDGTKDFVEGLEGFSVMIGLLERGRPVLGVVVQPVTGITYRAATGGPVEMLAAGGERITLAPTEVSAPASARLVVSNSHRSEAIDRIKQALSIEDELRFGSVGLKAGLVATGQRDLYVHPTGHCKLWDICAPEAILTLAGGRMTDLHGQPLEYDPAEIHARNGIIASNGACHDEVVRRLAPLFP